MAEKVWKLENSGAQGGPHKFAIVGYEQTAPREMKALKALEDLNQDDLRKISSVIHEYFHSED